MNREQRRLAKKENLKRPAVLTEMPRSEWPTGVLEKLRKIPIRVFVSQDYLVQEFEEENATRLSVNRTEMQANGQWRENIEWEELQEIKRQIGYGDHYAIEVYPRDRDIVNVANMRHLWVLDKPLPIGWANGAVSSG